MKMLHIDSEHKWFTIMSFHKKNFCLSSKCIVCHEEDLQKNIPYDEIDGEFATVQFVEQVIEE